MESIVDGGLFWRISYACGIILEKKKNVER